MSSHTVKIIKVFPKILETYAFDSYV